MPIVRAQADIDSNGKLDTDELKLTLKKPQFVNTAMENLDINMDGSVSLREWLIAQKATFDKSEAACKTSLKAMEKGACRRLHCALRHALTARAFVSACSLHCQQGGGGRGGSRGGGGGSGTRTGVAEHGPQM